MHLILPTMFEAVKYNIRNNTFILFSTRCIFWEDANALILSDLHLGKSGHFRKHGIAVPPKVFKSDMHKLISQIQFVKPSKIIIVGDLFHSHENKEHELFYKWRNDFPLIEFHLVKGNHDILKNKTYMNASIIVHEHSYSFNGFTFTHDIENCNKTHDYCFSGHIHPGITISGIAKQSIKLPCFYFSENYAVLPAFGNFTGTYSLKPAKGDTIFAIADNKIIKVYG